MDFLNPLFQRFFFFFFFFFCNLEHEKFETTIILKITKTVFLEKKESLCKEYIKMNLN